MIETLEICQGCKKAREKYEELCKKYKDVFVFSQEFYDFLQNCSKRCKKQRVEI